MWEHLVWKEKNKSAGTQAGGTAGGGSRDRVPWDQRDPAIAGGAWGEVKVGPKPVRGGDKWAWRQGQTL